MNDRRRCLCCYCAKMNSVALSSYAMATRFELLLNGADLVRLRALGEAALGEIERLEAQLSFYRSDSEITFINAHAAQQAVQVEPRLFRLLQQCAALTAATAGAFDITVGPLMRAWRFVNEQGAIPAAAELEAARAVTGMYLVELNEANFTVRFQRAGVQLDLGGYGKGYAVEQAMELLREAGVTSALLHGGTSSIVAIGAPPDASVWKVELPAPFSAGEQLALVDAALSVSAIHGKSFLAGGRRYGHVLDPRAGEPVNTAEAAAAYGPSAAVCEALSKALLVHGKAWLPNLSGQFTGYQGIVAN